MGVIGDNAVSSGDIMRRLRELEKRIEQMAAARRLEAASIGRGGLTVNGGTVTVRDTDGSRLAVLGSLGDGYRGTWIGRAGGGPAFAVYGTEAPNDEGFVSLWDRSGNYVFTDDAASGRGIGRPYLPLPVGEVVPPAATTTASDFADLAVGRCAIQHPVMYAYLLVQASDGSTAGEVRIALDGVGASDVVSVAAGTYSYVGVGPFVIPDPGGYAQLRGVSVQARRTAGSGTIGVRVMSLVGLESAYALT